MSDHYYAVSFNEDHLEHHGILGMKWGVRRYQNPDGTLTEEGKKRYRISDDGKIKKLTKEERAAAEKEQNRISNTKSPEAKSSTGSKKPSVEELAAKAKTVYGEGEDLFYKLARSSYMQLTDYGKEKELTKNPKYKKEALMDTFRRAFGDDPKAQREALKLLYSEEVTRFLEEEASDPYSSGVYNRTNASDYANMFDRENRNHDLAVGNDWGQDYCNEWRGYMEKNVGHKIDSLTDDERIAALKETGLNYDEDDLKIIRSLRHSAMPIQSRSIQMSNYRVTFKDDSDYLMHYGKKGMKWGVVNEDDVKKHKRIHKIDMNQMRVTDEKGNVIQTPGQGLSGVPAKYRWGAKKRDELQKKTGHTDKMMDDWELMDYRRQFKEEANSRWGMKKTPKEHLQNMRDVGREYEDAERKRQNQRALAKLTINDEYAKIKRLVENDLKDYIAYTGNIPTSKINVLRQNVMDIKKINAGLDKSIQVNYPDIDWESSLHPARKEIRSQSEYDEFVKKAKQYGLPTSGIRFAKGFKPNTARHDDFLAHRQVADTSGMKKSDAEAAEKATKVRDLLKSWDNTLATYNKANGDRTLRPDDKATIVKNIKKKQSKILAQLQEIDPKTADKIKDTRIV